MGTYGKSEFYLYVRENLKIGKKILSGKSLEALYNYLTFNKVGNWDKVVKHSKEYVNLLHYVDGIHNYRKVTQLANLIADSKGWQHFTDDDGVRNYDRMFNTPDRVVFEHLLNFVDESDENLQAVKEILELDFTLHKLFNDGTLLLIGE